MRKITVYNDNDNKKILFGILITAVISMIFIASGGPIARAQGNPLMPSAQNQGTTNATTARAANTNQPTIARDSQTILLEDKTIPTKGFIHVYDSTPYMITSGHIAATLPCDSNAKTPYNVLIGQAPNVKPAVLEYVKELSTPGKMCIYHVDISSEPGGKAGIITDIVLQNPTAKDVKFPPMSALVIGVDAIAPGAETGGNMNMTAGK